MEYKIVGRIIETLREQRGITQSELSNQIQVNQSSISRMEKGTEQISIELYERCLNYFKLELKERDTLYIEVIQAIFFAAGNNDSQAIFNYYKLIDEKEVHGIFDYFTYLMAQAIVYTHTDKFKEVAEIAEFLSHFTFVYDEHQQYYYHMVSAYALIHHQKVLESFYEFQKAYAIMTDLGEQNTILNLVYGMNNVSMRRYSTAGICFHNARLQIPEGTKNYAYYNFIKSIGTLHLFEGSFEQAIPYLEEVYHNEEFMKINDYFREQMDSFLGVCYLNVGAYEKALAYLQDGIDYGKLDAVTHSCFYYILYIYRLLEDKEHYELTFERFKVHSSYQNPLVQKSHYYFFDYEGARIDEMLKDFNYLYKELFSNPYKTVITRTTFQQFGEEIWKRRHYKNYKLFYDCVLNATFAHLERAL